MTNSDSLSAVAAAAVGGVGFAENRCQFYLGNKRRHCANSPLPNSKFCGNHDPSSNSRRVPCPIDPSHSVFIENLDSHVKRCPLKKQVETLETKPYYSKGINAGDLEGGNVGSDAKRKAIYEMGVGEFNELIRKIRAFHYALNAELKESFVEPDDCKKWIYQQVDRQLPYQEKHVMQQVSIMGNMEVFGILKKPKESSVDVVHEGGVESDGRLGDDEGESPAVVEFGAGRGYLAHMLADCYETKKIFLVERRSYKLKADRSLRQKESISLERLRIDIKDLDMHGIDALKGHRYLAIGKHLCGPATDLAIRCCISEQQRMDMKLISSSSHLQGLALATCCHHLCQWKHYINTTFMSEMGIMKEDFEAITWFSSWAVDGDHSSDGVSPVIDWRLNLNNCAEKHSDSNGKGVEEIIRNMQSIERGVLGFICKEIIDIGRLLWLKESGFDAQLLKYVPENVSPENHLLVAKHRLQT